MSAIVFDGKSFARECETYLANEIAKRRVQLRLGSLVFTEDEAGVIYTRLKKQAAVRVGVEFSEQEVSITEPLGVLQEKVQIYCQRADVTGVMVQKPTRGLWESVVGKKTDVRFEAWWQQIVGMLDPAKDVDCLTGQNLSRIDRRNWIVLPATVKAIVKIIGRAMVMVKKWDGVGAMNLTGQRAVVVGRSEIVGRPLASVLAAYGAQVDLFGRDLNQTIASQGDILVSATGMENLINPEMVKEGAIVIDVGAPKAEVQPGVENKVAFLTPVPGGVGPVTVVSLMENVVEMSKLQKI